MSTALASFALSFLAPLLLVPLGWLYGILIRKVRVGAWQRKQRRKTSWYPQYEVPDHLKPAEIAFLYDRTFGPPELLATLFDLENRDMLQLEPLPPGHATNDFIIRLKCTGTEKSLDEFEREVVLSIKVIKGRVRWSTLKADVAVFDSAIEKSLEHSLRQRGYFRHENPGAQHGWLFLLIGTLLALGTIVVPAVAGEGWLLTTLDSITDPHVRLSREISMVLIGAAGIVAAVLYAFTAKWVYGAFRRGLDTEQGTTRLGLLWPHLEGFRKYLLTVEQDRIQFENEDMRLKARQQALAYAVALNIPTGWEARFK